MTKIDLITGFLGAGKTTFLRQYAQWLVKQGQHIGILVHDFGAINVDRMLLQEVEGENCELEMLAGGCNRETYRRRFRTKLIALKMEGCERVLVEPSGIYDADDFFDVLREEPLDRWYEPGNVITVTDVRMKEISPAAEYLLASEAACAGCILMSRGEEASQEEQKTAAERLNRALEKAGCARRLKDEILYRDVRNLTEEDFERISSCGYRTESCRRYDFSKEESFDVLYFLESGRTAEEMRQLAGEIMEDDSCGKVLRIKGFLKTTEGGFWELNAVRGKTELRPADKGQEVLIVIGEGLKKEELERRLGSKSV